MAITRAAFLYLEPAEAASEATFAQCASCCLFLPDEDRCLIHGPDEKIDADDTCGLWVGGASLGGQPKAAVTPEESGLTRARVQCHRCEYGGRRCRLYVMLNRLRDFDLETAIHPHGCCNAWTAKRPSKGDLRYGT